MFMHAAVSHLNRSLSLAIIDSQEDKSVQARPSINVAFYAICQPQIWSLGSA